MKFDFTRFGTLDEIREMVGRWYRSYAEMGDEMAVQMFMDDLEAVYPYITSLYQSGAISFEEYEEFMAYCDELIAELMKLVGIEDIDRSFR